MARRDRFEKEGLYRATRLFKDGRFGEAWDRYEIRFREQPRLACPRWQGEDLSGRRLWIRREQGVGDEIQFASCVPDVVRSASATTITCDVRLERLFARSFPGATVIGEHPGVKATSVPPDAADYWIQSGSLGRYLRRSCADFPDDGAFLAADPRRAASFRDWIEAAGAGARIGIAWMGGIHLGALRQAPWDVWVELLRTPGARFVNLQYGPNDETLATLSRYAGVPILRPDLDLLGDLDGYAALVAALDLVVTVPNTTAHVAGALGVPSALVFDPDWGCL